MEPTVKPKSNNGKNGGASKAGVCKFDISKCMDIHDIVT